MERAHSRLQAELESHKDSTQTQLDFQEHRFPFDQQEQIDRLTLELSSLQTAHNTLRLFSVHTLQYSSYLSCSFFSVSHRTRTVSTVATSTVPSFVFMTRDEIGL